MSVIDERSKQVFACFLRPAFVVRKNTYYIMPSGYLESITAFQSQGIMNSVVHLNVTDPDFWNHCSDYQVDVDDDIQLMNRHYDKIVIVYT